MTLVTLGYKNISLWYERQEAETLNDDQRATVENDLNTLWLAYKPLLAPITFKGEGFDHLGSNVRTHLTGKHEPYVCYMNDRAVHGIDGESYWHYKAISNIVSQVLLWDSYHWSGSKKTWAHTNKILHALALSATTQEFVRSDILYRGAVNEYNFCACNRHAISNMKLVLKQFKTYAV